MRVAQDPNGWLEQVISRLVAEAPENRPIDFAAQLIFGPPLVGIADGDDRIFRTFRRSVSRRHLLPRDVLERHSPAGTDLRQVRVVSWVLPFSDEIRRSNRGRVWPSELYSVGRNNGGALNHRLSLRLTGLFREAGAAAVCPALTEQYDAFRAPRHEFSSSWSERHVAYAAGLGLFGLSGCLITAAGIHVRLGSLVTNLPLRVHVRKGSDHRAPCLRGVSQNCGHCIAKCPVGAISRQGLDKSKCYERRLVIRKKYLASYLGKFHLLASPIVQSGRRSEGFSLGCALCLSGVPCEKSDLPLRTQG
ncbi:MAG: hypothetical protein AB1715_09640 [Acidobacteriota bacterium]